VESDAEKRLRMEAQIEASTSQEERVDAAKEHLERMQRLEKQAETAAKAGLVLPSEVDAAGLRVIVR
jgi:outer membrane protein TolC